jgi:flagellar hook-basal body complex protein FliE
MIEVKSVGSSSSLHQKVLERTSQSLNTDDNAPSFVSRVGDAIKDVAEAQNISGDITKAYELGEETDLAKVMVTQQVSSLGFQMTLNIRNKVLSAYKDIMNMPV